MYIMADFLEGDILESDAKFICHQCNCITKGNGRGLAHSIFKKYPYANTYKNDHYQRIPGSISIHGNGFDQRYIINIYSQLNRGKPRINDSSTMRLIWLVKALSKLRQFSNLESIAFPYKLGCGLACGNWKLYRNIIDNFAKGIDAKVYIYKRPLDN